MKVVVLGAGVIGVTTAYFLAKAGHEVTVIESREAPGLETSYANAGEISPGYASPWAAPGVPAKAARWLLMRHAPLIVSRPFERDTAAWLFSTLMNCTPARYAINKARMVRLASYSRDVLQQLRQDTAIHYDERALGTLQLFRTQAQLDAADSDIAVLREYDIPFELLDRKACELAEPGLAQSPVEIAGGLRLPDDETGDCFMFTQALARLAETLGVQFRFNTRVDALELEGHAVRRIMTNHDPVVADAFVVAAGHGSRQLVRQVGLDLPVVPVKGYSLTVPISDPQRAPVSTVLDETYKVAITRLGDRIRIGGLAEIAGYDQSLNPGRARTLLHSFSSLFPDAGHVGEGAFWTGLRPMTPDSTPIVGGTAIDNLYVNTGHGTLGWTMACGSAKLLSDLVSNTDPDIAFADLSLARYSSN
ncbi:D-amino acid dehydrogenase [uncultured Brevundimonas sp.]|uniref:D-amino acid dehydrogenase n=1 Tax=uncultured Brevundimonas sp. TaxID=213418 RepID=UPI0030EE6F74